MTRMEEATAAPRVTVTMSRNEMLDYIANEVEKLGTRLFAAIQDVEHREIGELRAQSTSNTVLAPVEAALGAAGHETDGTVGNVMDILDLTADDLHHVACYCHQARYSGEEIAARLRNRKR